MVREKARLVRQPPLCLVQPGYTCLVGAATPALSVPLPARGSVLQPPSYVAGGGRLALRGRSYRRRSPASSSPLRSTYFFTSSLIFARRLSVMNCEKWRGWKGEGDRDSANEVDDGCHAGGLARLVLLVAVLPVGPELHSTGMVLWQHGPTQRSAAHLLAGRQAGVGGHPVHRLLLNHPGGRQWVRGGAMMLLALAHRHQHSVMLWKNIKADPFAAPTTNSGR